MAYPLSVDHFGKPMDSVDSCSCELQPFEILRTILRGCSGRSDQNSASLSPQMGTILRLRGPVSAVAVESLNIWDLMSHTCHF